MKYSCLIFLQIAFFFSLRAQGEKPFLSKLTATKDNPLYTTYAAALSRSGFIVDEGYQFVWYDDVKGLNFETDTGGDLCLGFKLNGSFRFLLNQFHSAPVITTSYSDLVKYRFYPFENISVEIFFLVYSSRIAIEAITITNDGTSGVQISVYPFLHHRNDVISDVGLISEYDGLIFRHKERPDGWTIDHGVPYQEDLLNVYIIDSPVDAYGVYSELGTPTQSESHSSLRKTAADYCVERGKVYHADSSLCIHVPPRAQQFVLHNGTDAEILTEEAPKWGVPSPNIPGDGWQSCELGNFRYPSIAQGDSFVVFFTCAATEQQGIGSGSIPTLPAAGGVQTDIHVTGKTLPPTPRNFGIHFSQNNASAVIRWDFVSGCFYSVYRRTDATPGRYDRIADSLTSTGYLDIGLNPDSTYGYVVVARDSSGRLSSHSAEVGNIRHRSAKFLSDVLNASLYSTIPSGGMKVAALQKNFSLQAGESAYLRIIRGVSEASSNVNDLIAACRDLRTTDIQQFVDADEQAYSRIPRVTLSNSDYEMVYWSAFSLLQQCMLPPEGKCGYNYYVFSREPQWGWGHGGQVFHESLSMLAYAYMDAASAMNSQRIYLERQRQDGYVNYRTGPYLDETIPYNDQLTTSAPWYAWENWEIYRITKDLDFLREMYPSSTSFYDYLVKHRDSDADGLCEWGAHAVLESVRDGHVAVWDQVGWPSNFECLDLNVMLVNESRSLAEMAEALGDSSGYVHWMQETKARTEMINRYMWDPLTEFYYHVDKSNHDFSFRTSNDLKRMEIIGFLPLWAGVASNEQANRVLQKLSDPAKFWRRFGVPTLSASDSYYNPMGYWNGPIWVQWQYLIFRGLLRYGYVNEARQLVEKVLDTVIHQLKAGHCFWELYSPDDYRAGWNKTYIWTGIVARMLIDLQNLPTAVIGEHKQGFPSDYQLKQNYPNPFSPKAGSTSGAKPVTSLEFRVPSSGFVSLKVFDVLGREVAVLVSEEKSAGEHRVTWDASDLSSGVYLYRLQAGGFVETKRMMLLR
ncbi:MAG: T9SS type A sorting domain-containing protein [Ignavibacteria bacterium]|nr:T9SS type A sorting domain-containing protein [Ignavibacteria bacterium]